MQAVAQRDGPIFAEVCFVAYRVMTSDFASRSAAHEHGHQHQTSISSPGHIFQHGHDSQTGRYKVRKR